MVRRPFPLGCGILKFRPLLVVTAVLLAGALALAAPAVAGAASPAKGGHGSTTTTTTTKPGSSGGQSNAFATLLIKPASIGHVGVETAGTTTFQPGTNNEQLHVGDTVQTDSVGLAEIDYSTNAWTRLNVSTTFTIKKLTDNQGNRQIDGGITSGETWNRTADLTQSESFTQDGGGVSAAVSGTAFVVDCTTPTQCTFTAVIDDTHLTGPNGQTQTLNPLTQCVTQNSALCTAPSMLTPDQLALIQWIQSNVLLDFTEHGIGNGVFDPFSGTVDVTNGVVTSFTPSTPNQPFTPSTPPPPPPPAPDPQVNRATPVCTPAGAGCTPAASLTTNGDDTSSFVTFQLFGGSNNGLPFAYQFLTLPTLGTLTTNSGNVDTTTQYDPSTQFQYTVGSSDPEGAPRDTFSYQTVDQSGTQPAPPPSPPATVQVTIPDTDTPN